MENIKNEVEERTTIFLFILAFPIAYKFERKTFPIPRIIALIDKIGNRFDAGKYSSLEIISITSFEKIDSRNAMGKVRNIEYLVAKFIR